MKPAGIALTAAGVALLALGIWASLVLPVRSVEEKHTNATGGLFVGSYSLNVWGQTLGYSHRVTYATEEQKPKGEGVGKVPDEMTYSGRYDWSKRRHGPWIRRNRFGTEWTEATDWYIHGKNVAREEWERR